MLEESVGGEHDGVGGEGAEQTGREASEEGSGAGAVGVEGAGVETESSDRLERGETGLHAGFERVERVGGGPGEHAGEAAGAGVDQEAAHGERGRVFEEGAGSLVQPEVEPEEHDLSAHEGGEASVEAWEAEARVGAGGGRRERQTALAAVLHLALQHFVGGLHDELRAGWVSGRPTVRKWSRR